MTESSPAGTNAGSTPADSGAELNEVSPHAALTEAAMPALMAAWNEALDWAVQMAVDAYFSGGEYVMPEGCTALNTLNYRLFSLVVPHDTDADSDGETSAARAHLAKEISDRVGVPVMISHYDRLGLCYVLVTVLARPAEAADDVAGANAVAAAREAADLV
jgi:hypothetical protein